MTPESLARMLGHDRAEWRALRAALDAAGEGPVHGPGSPAWTARDVYAHLARWMTVSTDALLARLTGVPYHPPQGTDDEINARWQAQDATLTLEQARTRAQEAFDRRVRTIEAVPGDSWDRVVEAFARADGYKHFAAHRRALQS